MHRTYAGVYFLLAGTAAAITAVHQFYSFSIVILAAAITVIARSGNQKTLFILLSAGIAAGAAATAIQLKTQPDFTYPAIYGQFTVEIAEDSDNAKASGSGLTRVEIKHFSSSSGSELQLAGKDAFIRLPMNTCYGYGDMFHLKGTLFTPKKGVRVNCIAEDGTVYKQYNTKPDGFDQYMINRGFAGTIYPQDELEKIATGKGFLRTLFLLREKTAGIISHNLPIQYSAIVEAMIFNQRANLTPETKQIFINSGIIHLFSVSGMHVGIVAVIIFWLMQPMPWRWRNVFTLAAVAIYVTACGAQPPAVRAAIMIAVYIISQNCGVHIRPLSAIAFAAVILLIGNPKNLFDLGFQFSFSVTAILLVFTMNEQKRRLIMAGDDIFRPLNKPHKSIRNFFKIYLPGSVMAGAAAYLCSMPLAMYHQGIFIPASFPGNLFILPLTPLIFIAAGVRAAVCMIPPLYQLSGEILYWLICILENSAAAVDSIFSTPAAITPGPWLTAAAVAAAFAIFINAKYRIAGITGMIIWFIAVFGATTIAKPFILIANGGTKLPMIVAADPADNFAAAINAPDFSTSLTVMEFLQNRGVNRINVLALTHANADDSRGLSAFSPNINLNTIVMPPGKPTSYAAKAAAPYPCRQTGISAICRVGNTSFTLKKQFCVLNYRQFRIGASSSDESGITRITLPNGTLLNMTRQKNMELYLYYLR